MDPLEFAAYGLGAIGILTVALASGFIVWLLFEDTIRKVFHMSPKDRKDVTSERPSKVKK